MNIVPSLVEGYMYSEMYHLEGGHMSGGFPLSGMSSSTEMVGGSAGSGIQLAHYVVPIGLVCDMRVAPIHIHYATEIPDSDDVIDDKIHDILYDNVVGKVSSKGSRKKLMRNPSKQKSMKLKK
jgi:hypothetical protein